MKARFSVHGDSVRECVRALLRFHPSLAPMQELDAVAITVESWKPKRTNEQNARYWKIVTALAAFAGMSASDMHDELLCDHFGYNLVVWNGSERKVPIERSSNKDTTTFSALMDTAERWCVENGVVWDE